MGVHVDADAAAVVVEGTQVVGEDGDFFVGRLGGGEVGAELVVFDDEDHAGPRRGAARADLVVEVGGRVLVGRDGVVGHALVEDAE